MANESFTLVPVATLTDAAGADSNIGNLSATINWGDGNTVTVTSTPSANGQIVATATAGVYTVEGSHTYTASGSYSVTVSAVDVGGSRADDSALPGTATVGNGVWVAGNWVDVTNPGGSLTFGDTLTAPAGETAPGATTLTYGVRRVFHGCVRYQR